MYVQSALHAHMHISVVLIEHVCNSLHITVSRGTKVAYRAKAHMFCTRKVYGWNFVY